MNNTNYYKIAKRVSYLLPALLVSCQVSSPIKDTPLVGQIATGINVIGRRSDLNETASLFAPRNFKNQRYQIPGTAGSEGGPFSYTEVAGNVRGDSAKEKEFIYECITRIDSNYYEWLEDYMRGRASLNTSLDILAQGLSAAGTIFTPATTVRVLSGSSTFVQGANATIESKFFLSLTALQQVPAMNAERKRVRGLLDNGASDFQQQLRLVEEYYIAGTIFTAIGVEKDG